MNNKALVFIHLSDIHFRHRRSGTKYDLDKELRSELSKDAKQRLENIGTGKTDAVLITGDIAYSGKKPEYETASEWLKEFCLIVGCKREDVKTTPGNHDVDRSVVENSHILEMIHQDLRPNDENDVDSRLEKWLRDDLAASVLFSPLKEYNEFANPFGCYVGPENLSWNYDFYLNDGSILRLHGLNSTLVSDRFDNDGENRLTLGSIQANIIREEGVEHMILCHHPPQWIRGQDRFEDTLSAKARIQLFGHKHRQRADQINESLRLSAGAVHPDRDERNWEPRYNLFKIEVNGQGYDRYLKVTVYPRIWSDTEFKFKADYEQNGSECKLFSLKMAPWESNSPVAINVGSCATMGEEKTNVVPQPGDEESPQIQAMRAARRMTYRFFTLPYHVRLAIAQRLDLLEDDDKGVEDHELFKRFFQRAKQKEILAKLWEEVESKHTDPSSENPFSKA